MKKKNGFVLIETLVVVLLLTVTLMSLYATFSYMVSKTRERNNNDSIETVYKSYFVKNVMDNLNAAKNNTARYKNSFLFYAIDSSNSWNSFCKAYSYTDGRALTKNYDASQIIICDFSNGYLGSASGHEDPLYETVVTYGIKKMYYLDFSLLPVEDDMKAQVLNLFDASSIDYVTAQSTDLNGDNLIIKYQRKYEYPSNHVSSSLDLTEEVYHSTIAFSEIKINSTAKVINYYETVEAITSYPSPRAYSDGEKIILPSAVDGFTSHNGKTVRAWVTSRTLSESRLDECLAAGSSGITNAGEQVYCYYPQMSVTVTNANRDLFALWCGDTSINAFLECNASTEFRSTPLEYNKTTRIYKFNTNATNNYVRLGNYCWRMLSNFDPSNDEGIKLIYGGRYGENGCTTGNDVFIGNSSFNDFVGFNAMSYRFKSGLTSKVPDTVRYTSKYEFLEKIGVVEPISYNDVKGSVETKTLIFALNVDYENGKYILKNVTDPISLDDHDAFLKTANYKYACANGTTSCNEVYFIKTTSKNGDKLSANAYKFTGGTSVKTLERNTSLYFANNYGTYSSNRFNVRVNQTAQEGVLITIADLFDPANGLSKAIMEKYKYVCMPTTTISEGSQIICNEMLYIVRSDHATFYEFIKYTGSKNINQVLNSYIAGNGQKGDKSNVMTMIDNWYNEAFVNDNAGRAIADIIKPDAYFLNDLKTENGLGHSDEYPVDGPTMTYYTLNRYVNGVSAIDTRADTDDAYKYSKNSGNRMLDNSIALLSVDEALYLGAKNKGGYLAGGQEYWLFSPYDYSNGFTIKANGTINKNIITTSLGVRPVIEIYRNSPNFIILNGDGTASNPLYIVKGRVLS